MYKTWSGSHSFLPWVVIHQKEFISYIMGNHNALSEIFIYLINVLTHEKIMYVL